ncbi:MAG: hypothetical protein QGH45_08340 [Myxococcota bacterium]|jgi:hypothetical protein|nr:hypothetical protein [Myxococcota bacterium]
MTTRRSAICFALTVALGVTSLGCKAPPEAPEELSDLSRYLFREFESEEWGVREVGMGNLAAFFADQDMDVEWDELSYTAEDLQADDVVDVEHPGRDLTLLMPVGMATLSAFTPADHSTVIVMPDQTPVEPNSPNTYDRTFTEPTGPGCFPGLECDLLRSTNDIAKENALMNIPYEMNKDWRWVELGEPDSGEWAILGRSWCEDVAVGEEGKNEINQSFSIDVFLPRDGGTVRFMVLWSESVVPGFGEDVIMGTIEYGMHQMFDATEDYLVENS